MRILMLTSSWPLNRGDWRGGFVYDMALDLARRGHWVDVAVPRPPPGRCDYDGHTADDDCGNLKVHWLPALTPFTSSAFHGHGLEANLKSRPLSGLSMPPSLAAFTLECGMMVPFADVIVSNWVLPMGLVGATLSRMSDRPHLVIAHSAPVFGVGRGAVSKLVRAVVSSAASVACVSGSVRDSIAEMAGPQFSSRLEVRHLGVDIGAVVPRPSVVGRPMDLLFAGRLVGIKGFDILLRALWREKGFRLKVAGDGPDRPGLESLARILDVEAVFVGETDRGTVRNMMAQSDLLVVPSRRKASGREEGLPRVVTEAWSAGLPVVAADTGGMPALIRSYGGGELFASGSASDLRKTLVGLRDEPSRLETLRAQAMKAALEFDSSVKGAEWEGWISAACS